MLRIRGGTNGDLHRIRLNKLRQDDITFLPNLPINGIISTGRIGEKGFDVIFKSIAVGPNNYKVSGSIFDTQTGESYMLMNVGTNLFAIYLQDLHEEQVVPKATEIVMVSLPKNYLEHVRKCSHDGIVAV